MVSAVTSGPCQLTGTAPAARFTMPAIVPGRTTEAPGPAVTLAPTATLHASGAPTGPLDTAEAPEKPTAWESTVGQEARPLLGAVNCTHGPEFPLLMAVIWAGPSAKGKYVRVVINMPEEPTAVSAPVASAPPI